ncbi:carotenoid 1,2-hydratase [Phenylobacterium sp.]|uniref:lipocalin-like domain-containing protein n=1 Tax=Phenylobacterium sp. TaxID=1871053 RepID=UPI0027305754|nr:carotenoid 1,2-hydratase [Phenylobacterium sp.]MDP1873065.1 carotenoid 1,2-hydratase [Phenylobacterium sp.]
MIPRRAFAALLAAGLTLPAAPGHAQESPGGVSFAPVRPGRRLSFPTDHGAHPDFRTEWWYVTGWLQADGQPIGFQITFFRIRTAADPRNPSAFSPRQVIFAHAAISDPRVGRLLHAQRIARAGFGLAEAKVGDMDLVLDDWRLRRTANGVLRAQAGGEEFALNLTLEPTQPVLLQGQQGFSRKGPGADQASYYYSLPHLKVSGALVREGRRRPVTGEAWLDQEWSSTLLDARAVGWDWAGINLDDGAALTAFQVRDGQGQAVWAGGSLRAADGGLTTFGPGDVRFATRRQWRSPRTAALYPIARDIQVRTPQGARIWRLEPLFDDQELDSRPVGPVYWEGAVRTEGGRGYLELTGYDAPLAL